MTTILWLIMALGQQSGTISSTATGTTVAFNHYNLNEKRKECAALWVDKLHSGWSIGFDSKWCYIEIAPAPQQAHMPVCLDDLVPSTNGRCERIRSGWILVPCREELKPSCFSNAKGEWFLEPFKTESTPPFDVPPVEIEKISEAQSIGNGEEMHLQCDPEFSKCTFRKKVPTCADKSRFLLMSEDGKWHCLALGQR